MGEPGREPEDGRGRRAGLVGRVAGRGALPALAWSAVLVHLLLGLTGWWEVVATLLYGVVTLSGLVALAVASVRSGRDRSPWVLLSGGAAVLVFDQLALVALSPVSTTRLSLSAFQHHPHLAAAGLLAYPLLYAGQMALLRQRVEGLLPSAWLDGLISTCLLAAVGFAFVLPQLRPALDLGVVGAVALVGRPALDLLMFAFSVANWSLSGWRADRRLPMLVGVLVLLLASDATGVLHLAGVLDAPAIDPVVDSTRLVSLLLLVVAARRPGVPASGHQPEGWSILIAPLLALVVATAVIAVDQRTPVGPWAVDLCLAIVLGVGVKVAVVFREVVRLNDSRRQAHTDDLTGLANRRAMTTGLRDLGTEAGAASLLVLDLDRFKEVNDRFGHAVGDELLRRTADGLRGLVPPSALLARLGGDEFALLLPGAGTSRARAVAERIVEVVGEPVVVEGRPLRTGASVGIATTGSGPGAAGRTAPAIGGEELLRQADAAMYLAKGAGGGVSVYDEAVDDAARERALMVEELRAALLQPVAGQPRQVVVHYQPQVDAVTGRVCGVEALVRWQHPRRGLLAPDAFLGLVEEHGLMGPLTTTVLRQAVRQALVWRRAGRPLRMSVNLSASCLVHPDLLPLIDEVVGGSELPADVVTVEITETTLMSDPEHAVRTCRAIARRGLGVSIDDYGTGYSSLAYLNELPATELKLDRTFTARLLHDDRTAAIVQATIALAHQLELRVVAEGVEDERTLAALRRLGCDETQGYLHSRPLPPEQLDAWLTAGAGGARPALRPAVDLTVRELTAG